MTDSIPDKKPGATPVACTNTRYVDRMVDALALLCGGVRPPKELVVAWEENTSEELQTWAVCHAAAPWATGIGTIEAAQTLAATPEEGMEHQDRVAAFPDTRATCGPTPASELLDRIDSAVGDDWNLAIANGGQGSLSTSDGIIYFNSASQLDDAVNELIAK